MLGQLQTVAKNKGHTDFVTRAVQSVESWPAGEINAVLAFGQNISTGVRDAHRLRQENAELRAIAQSAEIYNEAIDRVQKQIDALNAMVGYDAPGPFQKVFAGVVGYFPNENRITLDKGSDDGIKPHMPVVAAGGLVGIVETVDKSRSQVLLVTSRAIRVAAKILAQPDVPGILRGETQNRLVFELLASDDVHTGEQVVTSGHSEDTPAGISIGIVVEVIDDPQFGTKRVFVLPNLHMGAVDEVFVLK